MYRVTKSDNTIEFLSQIQYVCKQRNGVVICCNKDKAHGIISKDNSKIYAFKDTDISNDYEVVEVEEIDEMEFMLEQQTNMELAMAEIYEIMLGGIE